MPVDCDFNLRVAGDRRTEIFCFRVPGNVLSPAMNAHRLQNSHLPVAAVLLLLVFSIQGCGGREGAATTPKQAGTPEVATKASGRKFDFRPRVSVQPVAGKVVDVSFPEFQDVAADCGIEHVFDNGASPRALMVESTGGGAGWLDFDRDGRLDLYLTQGGDPCPAPSESRPLDSFYRQMSPGAFVEASSRAGLHETGFGHGVAAADFNNDGFDDLFIANAGPNHLLLNLGDGTFDDVTESLDGAVSSWSSTAAWGDIDRDGDLDLYVCNYAIYDPCHPVECLDKEGIPSICHPRNVEPEPDDFFLNSGNGQLQERSQELGLYGDGNKGLGVVIADLTGDDRPDLYVANDTTANFLFVSDDDGRTFRNEALILGGGFSATGETQASMGIAFGDYDNNGYPDLLLTHFTGEANTLYRNLGPKGLQDVSGLTGLREPSLPKLGFGTVMSDFNCDGLMDLFVTNGHIDPRYFDGEGYAMSPQLLTFDGTRWRESVAESGSFFTRKAVGRSVASADFDDDGDLDLCIVHHNSPTALLRNDSVRGHGMKIRFVGLTSNRNGLNAKVRLTAGTTQYVQELPGGTSYAATHEKALFFGLGDYSGSVAVEVLWPSGLTDRFEVDQSIADVTVVEANGPIGL